MYSDTESLPPEGHHGGHLGGWGPWETTRGPVCPSRPWFGTVTLRPGLVSHLGTQAWGQLHFRSAPSTPAGSPSWFFSQSWWLHLCLFGVGPACSSPEGPWDLWAELGCSGVSECVRHYLKGRGEESGQVRGGSWWHGVRDLGSLDGRATAGEGLGGSLTPPPARDTPPGARARVRVCVSQIMGPSWAQVHHAWLL